MKHYLEPDTHNKDKSKLVLFDVDGTLLHDRPDEISGRLFWLAFRTHQMKPSPDTVRHLWHLRDKYQNTVGQERQQYLSPLIKEFDRNIPGKSRTAMGRLARKCITYDLDHYFYSEMHDEITRWRHEGATLGLISGSPDFYIQELKKALHFDIATGTQHFRNGNTYNNRPAESRASEKHRIAEGMLSKLGAQACLAAAYGDTMNDKSMLDMAVAMGGEAVAVNPKNGLEHVAQQNNWRIIRSQTVENERAISHRSLLHL